MKTQATRNKDNAILAPTLGEYVGMVLVMAGVGVYTYLFLTNI